MSRLDWCQNVLLKHSCYDWKNDNCDGCNIFQAYCEGAARAKKTERESGEWVNDPRYSGWTCTHCNYHDGNKTDKFCPNCGAKMGGDKE